jgi:hypothetical protein
MEEGENRTSDSFLLENPERRFEDDRLRWSILEVGDGATGDSGSGIIWGVDVVDACGAWMRELGEEIEGVKNPWVGSAGDVLNDIDRLCGDEVMGDAGMDTEEAETACVVLDLAVVPPEE